MSAKMVGAVWELELPQAEAWVLMALADHAHHDGSNVFASQKLLAWKTNYSERQVRRILESLEIKGIIVPENIGGGRGVVQGYKIDLSAGRKKPALPDNRSNCPAIGSKNPVKLSGAKEDKTSGFPAKKADKMSDDPPDISDTKRGHLAIETRTFQALNADISLPSHDKERARLTKGTMENHGEPEEDTRETAAASEEAEMLARIEGIQRVILDHYSSGPITRQFEGRVIEVAGKLNGMGCTKSLLAEFLTQRHKLPSLNFLAADWQVWKLNHDRARAKNGAAAHVGLAAPASQSTGSAKDAEILQAAEDFAAEYPDPEARPGWVVDLLNTAGEIRRKLRQEAV